jgi:hypothetical protein
MKGGAGRVQMANEDLNPSKEHTERSKLPLKTESKEFTATVLDIGVDKLIESDVLDGIPVFGLLLKSVKTVSGVRDWLLMRKVARFVEAVSSAEPENQEKFLRKLEQEGKRAEFNENLLLLLERLDDVKKPVIAGNIMAGLVEGHIEYATALRLVAVVSRCYVTDLEYLSSFRSGVQTESMEIVASLFSYGLLTNTGFDAGTFANSSPAGGPSYELNRYGELLLQYGLKGIDF